MTLFVLVLTSTEHLSSTSLVRESNMVTGSLGAWAKCDMSIGPVLYE
jgi:hypothetical protein